VAVYQRQLDLASNYHYRYVAASASREAISSLKQGKREERKEKNLATFAGFAVNDFARGSWGMQVGAHVGLRELKSPSKAITKLRKHRVTRPLE